MALPSQLIAREQAKFVESQNVSGFPAVGVTNPDGSNIFSGSALGLLSLPSINGQVFVNNVASLASIYGLVNVTSLPSIQGSVSFGGVISLASGQYINIGAGSSLPSINGTMAFGGVISLASGQFIGLNGVLSLASGQTILTKEQNLMSLASGQYIGIGTNSSLPSITGLVQVNNVASIASIYGVVSLGPNSNSGWTPYSFLSLSSLVQQIKSGQGELGGWFVFNSNTSACYVQIFDSTLSSASLLNLVQPKISLPIPPGAAANLEAANGISFLNGIEVAATTTPNGATGPTNPLVTNFWYK